MDKQKLFQLLYVILIVGVILFMIWIVIWLKSESAMCMKDPLGFVAEKIPTEEWEFDLCVNNKCYTCQQKFVYDLVEVKKGEHFSSQP